MVVVVVAGFIGYRVYANAEHGKAVAACAEASDKVRKIIETAMKGVSDSIAAKTKADKASPCPFLGYSGVAVISAVFVP